MTQSHIDADPAVTPVRRRRWVAIILTLLGGVGYLYVGRPRRYVAYLVFGMLIWLPLFHGLWGWLSDPAAYVAYLAFILVTLIGFIFDAAWIAARETAYRLRWYNRWWAYVGALAIGVATSFVPDLLGGHEATAARSFSIPSGSMMPTLQIGDVLVADTRIYGQTEPRRGDVVIFKLPRDGRTDFVKRVVGLPGDKVRLVRGEVLLNDKPLERTRAGEFEFEPGQRAKVYRETLPDGPEYDTLDIRPNPAADDTRTFEVPPGHFFLLGDNRDNSLDSRFDEIGFVPRNNIFARAGGIVFSREPGRIGTRLR